MSRRVQTTDDLGGFRDWWSSIPPVTKVLGSVWGISALLIQFQIFPHHLMLLDTYMVFRKFQIWRLITNSMVVGSFSMPFAMRMIWLFTYSPVLERITSEFSPGEYAFMILFSILSLDLIGMLNPITPIYFSGKPLVFTILYLWSREFASQAVSIYGLVQIKAFYLPWSMLAVGLIFGHSTPSLLEDLIGIAVGHIYYFLTTIYFRVNGTRLLRCPLWLNRFMGKFYKSKRDPQSELNQERILQKALPGLDHSRELLEGSLIEPFRGQLDKTEPYSTSLIGS